MMSPLLPSAAEAPIGPDMDLSELRVAIFSGNYNYVRDGANQALNRLVRHLESRGAAVRVYSPTTDTPAFEPAGIDQAEVGRQPRTVRSRHRDRRSPDWDHPLYSRL